MNLAMELGIYTPYHRGEVTAAALRLADLASTIPYDVKLLAPGNIEKGIHPYWDNRVISVKKTNIYKWANHCTHLIWFDYHKAHHAKSKLVADKAQQWYITDWHKINRSDYKETWLYDCIVSPAKAIYKQVDQYLAGDAFTSTTWCQWDSGLDPIKRRAEPHTNGRVKIYIPLDGDTLDIAGMLVLNVLHSLLESHPQLDVTLDRYKSWNKTIRAYVKKLRADFGEDRFKVAYNTSLIWQTTYLHEHDWTWIPTLRSGFGQNLWRALSCGTPVICYDVEPFSEFIRHGVNGYLIGCDITTNWLGSSMAVPTGTQVIAEISEVINSEKLLSQCRKCDWGLKKHRDDFELFWKNEWQGE